jgi:hypothetical protein
VSVLVVAFMALPVVFREFGQVCDCGFEGAEVGTCQRFFVCVEHGESTVDHSELFQQQTRQ